MPSNTPTLLKQNLLKKGNPWDKNSPVFSQLWEMLCHHAQVMATLVESRHFLGDPVTKAAVWVGKKLTTLSLGCSEARVQKVWGAARTDQMGWCACGKHTLSFFPQKVSASSPPVPSWEGWRWPRGHLHAGHQDGEGLECRDAWEALQ